MGRKIKLKHVHREGLAYRFWLVWKQEGFCNAVAKGAAKVHRAFMPDASKDMKMYCSIPALVYDAKVMEAKRPKIYVCAYRVYDESRGLTGGPGGVLAMQQSVFGPHYRGFDMEYVFEDPYLKYPNVLLELIRDYQYSISKIFKASYYVTHHLQISNDIAKGVEPLFICHDIGSAYGAYLMGRRYIVIYHQQGGLINELEGFRLVLTEQEKYLINSVERIVMEHASKVFFPSMGAAQAYRGTSLEGQERSEYISFADHALYNTIPEMTENLDYAKKLRAYELPDRSQNDMDVFLSIGDYNTNKGMDRVPKVLERYASVSGRRVLWIAIGSRTDIYDRMLEEKEGWNFETVLIGKRADHDTVLSFIDYADYYIMLQRVSIFDLAVLEAMRGGMGMILSKAGGNREVNVKDNIVFWDEGETDQVTRQIMQRDKKKWARLNADMFQEFFSQKCFFDNYAKMMDEELKAAGYLLHNYSEKNKKNLSPWKNRFAGKKAVICGAGKSLEDCDGRDTKAVYIALNRAVFYEKVTFDILFMQDLPQNQPYTIDDYNAYPCTKFYGSITNPRHQELGFHPESYAAEKGEIINYELSPVCFDYRIDDITFRLEEEWVLDMQSVLFSAVQFAVFAGFQEILLYGVEFSETNYGGNQNPNTYSMYVPRNLKRMKNIIAEKYPNITFSFASTTNKAMKEYFADVEKKQGKGSI